ncbi:MAG TPA: class I SAM-dependent methyltransferase [Blastocatellia bacterium]|nr:class I SAM-dependent methyltransferase [Blastocatellia bacterium]
MIDIGTGDGLFVYQCARQNPKKFYIGIDASPRPLEKLSQKIHRNPAKGGLPNVLYIQAAVEDLPPELDGVADEVHIHFPWGSLLRAVATGDEGVLRKLRKLSSPGALLEVIIGLDPKRDRSEIERLGLRPLSAEYMEEELIPRYESGGFDVLEAGVMGQSQWAELNTSWAKRLKGNPEREVVYIVARARGARSPAEGDA